MTNGSVETAQGSKLNSKQFISSLIFHGADLGVSRWPWIGPVLAVPVRLIFPTMAYERVSFAAMRWQVLSSVYAVGVAICFALQAWLAHRAGVLGTLDLTFTPQPPSGTRILFFDDIFNLINYLLIVPLYLVAGTGFMISLFSLKERMVPAAADYGFSFSEDLTPLLSGVGAVGAFIALLVYTQAGYAVDVTENSDHFFWFHGETREAAFGYNGYAYLVINTFLASFVILVALLHLEMFRWSRVIVRAIRGYDAAAAGGENLFLDGGDRLKELFSPFTETAIWSKAFAMALAINIFTWQLSGVSGGSDPLTQDSAGAADNTWFFRFVLVIYLVLVLWIVSLPRYRIQYEIFRQRKERGVHEYFDIRMPWTIGWSVLIDLVLLFFFSIAIFGPNDLMSLTISLFGE